MTEKDLDQAIADAEWVERQARVTLQQAERAMTCVRPWRHPVLWLRFRRRVRALQRMTS